MRIAVIAALLSGCVLDRDVGHNAEPDPDSGSPPAAFTVLTRGPRYAFEVVGDAETLYWNTCDQGANRSTLRRISKAGGDEVELALLGKRIYRIAAGAEHIYLAVYGVSTWDGSVQRVAKGGGPPEVLIDGLWNTYAIDVDDTHVYFGHQVEDHQEIWRVPVGGGAPDRIVLAVENPWDLAVDDEFVYYAEMNAGRIMRVAKGGGEPVELAGGWVGTVRLVVDDADVIFTACLTGECDSQELYAVPKQGGDVRLLATVPRADGIALAGPNIVVGKPVDGTVVAVPRAGGEPWELVSGRPAPYGVTADADGGRVFWVDYESGDVGRVLVGEGDE